MNASPCFTLFTFEKHVNFNITRCLKNQKILAKGRCSVVFKLHSLNTGSTWMVSCPKTVDTAVVDKERHKN